MRVHVLCSQVVELNPKQMKVLHNDLSHAVTAVTLSDRAHVRMIMLTNPASRLKHARLPVISTTQLCILLTRCTAAFVL